MLVQKHLSHLEDKLHEEEKRALLVNTVEHMQKSTPWSPWNTFILYKFSLDTERFKIWVIDSSLPASDRTALFCSRLDLVLISVLKFKTGTAPGISGEYLDTKVTVGLLDLIKPAALSPSIDFLFVITGWFACQPSKTRGLTHLCEQWMNKLDCRFGPQIRRAVIIFSLIRHQCDGGRLCANQITLLFFLQFNFLAIKMGVFENDKNQEKPLKSPALLKITQCLNG